MLFLSLDFYFFHEFSFDRKKTLVSTTIFGQRSIWQVVFFFCWQKHMTTTELVINQQALTLVWWHCFYNPTATRTISFQEVSWWVVFVSLFPSLFFQKYFPPHYSSDNFLLKPCSTLLYKYIYMVVDIYVFYLLTI